MQTKPTTTAKSKQKSGVNFMDETLGGHGGPKLGWSSLEDINDPDAVWPKAVNRVAAAACKDRTANEIFRQIGEELGKMGVSSVFSHQGSQRRSSFHLRCHRLFRRGSYISG